MRKLLRIGGMLVMATSLVVAGGPTAKNVTVTIDRVKQLDDLDKSTPMISKDRADFYVQIWINGRLWTSQNLSTDDGRPDWSFTVPVTTRTANIRIKLLDDDGGLEKRDDYVDVNPKANKKDLNLKFDTQTGKITGDVSGRKGQTLQSKGKYDSSQGQIWFTVSETH